MSLVKKEHKFKLESVMVSGAKNMLVRRDKRFMILPSHLRDNLDKESFAREILSEMDRSAAVCREQLHHEEIDINILLDAAVKPVDGVDFLTNINRIAIRRDGKTVSIAKYFGSGWDVKIYPRYGLEDGVYTPNIGKFGLPNVFEYVVSEALKAKKDGDDWKEFVVLCFDQYVHMISTSD